MNSKIGIALLLQLFLTKGAMSMEKPNTILEIVGAPPVTDLDKSVLIMIDYQYEYRDGKLALPGIQEVLANSEKLLVMARRHHVPVIHVVQQGSKGVIFDGHNGEIFNEVRPIAGEVVIEKSFPNAFAGTTLAEQLKAYPARHQLIIAGLMTHMCISSTASAAVEHGYFSTVISSTTTTRNLKGTKDRVIDAEAIKAAALASIKDRFANVVDNLGDLN